MIRVDNMEQIQELRKKGVTGDIIFISRGEDDKPETQEVKEESSEVKEETKDTTDTKTESIDYDKIINGVTEKLTPLIQEKNRKTGFEVVDETLDDIMKKFAEL